MSGVVAEIARQRRASRRCRLREVSTAADQMDKVTQQNAAMVEETTAAAQTLTAETEELAAMVEHFTTSAPRQTQPLPITRRAGAAPRASSGPVVQMRSVGSGGGAAPKATVGTDSWEEF